MERKKLEKEAAMVWVEYGNAICKVFGFDGNIIAYSLLSALKQTMIN